MIANWAIIGILVTVATIQGHRLASLENVVRRFEAGVESIERSADVIERGLIQQTTGDVSVIVGGDAERLRNENIRDILEGPNVAELHRIEG